ncbi:hypothetical protein JB92DRAFT_3129570 [Gautieria morchelliformis]|nr:hypothetical protein JB92DRAFT_3129570 [Gautieria morchelliformis]
MLESGEFAQRRICDPNELYLNALHAPNLELVQDDIVEVLPRAVRTATKTYVTVLATGFETQELTGALRNRGRDREWLHCVPKIGSSQAGTEVMDFQANTKLMSQLPVTPPLLQLSSGKGRLLQDCDFATENAEYSNCGLISRLGISLRWSWGTLLTIRTLVLQKGTTLEMASESSRLVTIDYGLYCSSLDPALDASRNCVITHALYSVIHVKRVGRRSPEAAKPNLSINPYRGAALRTGELCNGRYSEVNLCLDPQDIDSASDVATLSWLTVHRARRSADFWTPSRPS